MWSQVVIVSVINITWCIVCHEWATKWTQIPLRYSIRNLGSRSTISDCLLSVNNEYVWNASVIRNFLWITVDDPSCLLCCICVMVLAWMRCVDSHYSRKDKTKHDLIPAFNSWNSILYKYGSYHELCWFCLKGSLCSSVLYICHVDTGVNWLGVVQANSCTYAWESKPPI